MYEDLDLDVLAADTLQHIFAELTCGNYPHVAETAEQPRGGGGMHRHLRRGVQHRVGDDTAHYLRCAPVLHYVAVDSELGGQADIVGEALRLVVGNDRIHRKIELRAVAVTEPQSLRELLVREVCGTASRGEALTADIYGVSARPQSGCQRLGTARRSENLGRLTHMLSLSCLSLTIFSSCTILALRASISLTAASRSIRVLPASSTYSLVCVRIFSRR